MLFVMGGQRADRNLPYYCARRSRLTTWMLRPTARAVELISIARGGRERGDYQPVGSAGLTLNNMSERGDASRVDRQGE